MTRPFRWKRLNIRNRYIYACAPELDRTSAMVFRAEGIGWCFGHGTKGKVRFASYLPFGIPVPFKTASAAKAGAEDYLSH